MLHVGDGAAGTGGGSGDGGGTGAGDGVGQRAERDARADRRRTTEQGTSGDRGHGGGKTFLVRCFREGVSRCVPFLSIQDELPRWEELVNMVGSHGKQQVEAVVAEAVETG